MLEIHPEVSSLKETLSAGPRISTREATTTIVVKDGQTIVIAGLIQNDKTVIRQRVPFLSSLPFIGLAFRNKSVDLVTKELAVFITPYLIKPLLGEEGEPVVDLFTSRLLFNRAVRLTEKFGIESLGKSEGQRFNEAIGLFKAVVRNFPESDLADDALFQLGSIYDEQLKNAEQAAKAWNKLLDEHPASPYLTEKLRSRLKKLDSRLEVTEPKREEPKQEELPVMELKPEEPGSAPPEPESLISREDEKI